jgi:hypothetical protein
MRLPLRLPRCLRKVTAALCGSVTAVMSGWSSIRAAVTGYAARSVDMEALWSAVLTCAQQFCVLRVVTGRC